MYGSTVVDVSFLLNAPPEARGGHQLLLDHYSLYIDRYIIEQINQ
jgi:hypothetical protein